MKKTKNAQKNVLLFEMTIFDLEEYPSFYQENKSKFISEIGWFGRRHSPSTSSIPAGARHL